MENTAIERKSYHLSKFSGLLIATVIVAVTYVVPVIPFWVAAVALYPLVTSLVDIVLDLRH